MGNALFELFHQSSFSSVGDCPAYHRHGLGLHGGVYLLRRLDGQRQRRPTHAARGWYSVLVSSYCARRLGYQLAAARAVPKFGNAC